jgi:hypothetical protein
MKFESKTPLSKVIINSFFGGIAWAAGATIGLTILVAIISYILNLLGGLPFIGEIIGQIVQYTQQYLNATTPLQ